MRWLMAEWREGRRWQFARCCIAWYCMRRPLLQLQERLAGPLHAEAATGPVLSDHVRCPCCQVRGVSRISRETFLHWISAEDVADYRWQMPLRRALLQPIKERA